MFRTPPMSTRTTTLLPYTPFFRSLVSRHCQPARRGRADLRARHGRAGEDRRAGAPDHPPRRSEARQGDRDSLHWPASRREAARGAVPRQRRSEEHTSELQSLMRISYDVFCLKKKKPKHTTQTSAAKHYMCNNKT